MKSDIQKAYDHWSIRYDTNENKTRDLEAQALKALLSNQSFYSCLEIGCGTGKNTVWLAQQCKEVTAVDFSNEMLEIAKEKIQSPHIHFHRADILQQWTFAEKTYDLITFSLVLEHIYDLNPIFSKSAGCLHKGGLIYVGELHPFKQYSGSKAKFETEVGVEEVTCFTHHITDFTESAGQHGLELIKIKEFFDGNDRHGVPRILSLLFKKVS